MIKVPTGWDVRELRVLGLSDKRLGAALAQALFEETEESVKNGKRTKRQESLMRFIVQNLIIGRIKNSGVKLLSLSSNSVLRIRISL